VFQNYALYPHLTVLENIMFPLQNLKGEQKMTKQAMKEKALETAKLVQIERLMGRKPSQLSGGQQQRTSIGRAIVKNPDILLCDEPTGALDYSTSKEILKLIERINLKYHNTIVMVTHNDAIKYMADCVIQLRDGAVSHRYRNEKRMPAEEITW
jgi:ABC-type antimicrobial peptide transport system, ATPase component